MLVNVERYCAFRGVCSIVQDSCTESLPHVTISSNDVHRCDMPQNFMGQRFPDNAQLQSSGHNTAALRMNQNSKSPQEYIVEPEISQERKDMKSEINEEREPVH